MRKYRELDIAKGIAIIAVVLGHAFPDADYGISNFTANTIHTFVYGFHMPVFFFIAGLLSAKHSGDKPLNYIKKRAAKLLIPYFLLSIVGLVLKQVFASEANHTYELYSSWKILLGQSPMGGMWYLWTLFLMSVVFIFLVKFIKKDWQIVLIGMLLFYIGFYRTIPFMNNFANFVAYFMLGVACKDFYDQARELDQKVIACATIPTYWMCIKLYAPELVQGMVGIVMILSVSSLIKSSYLEDMGRKSYAIYLMSYFIAIPIRVICYQRLALNYWLVVVLMFTLGLFIPYGIACLYEKHNDKKKVALL